VLDGTVLDASYIGVSTQYLVKTAEGHTLTVYAQNLTTSGASQVLSQGQQVRLTWNPQHTFVIDNPDQPAPTESLEETTG
jgi:spermidine/putrescine transport system ATP-binding protein